MFMKFWSHLTFAALYFPCSYVAFDKRKILFPYCSVQNIMLFVNTGNMCTRDGSC